MTCGVTAGSKMLELQSRCSLPARVLHRSCYFSAPQPRTAVGMPSSLVCRSTAKQTAARQEDYFGAVSQPPWALASLCNILF